MTLDETRLLFFLAGFVAAVLVFGAEFYRRGRDVRRWQKRATRAEDKIREFESRADTLQELESARRTVRAGRR